MNRDDEVLDIYPPHPEEGASPCASKERNHCVAPVSKDGAAPWFETPRTRLRNLGRRKIAAPHHEAGRDRESLKLIGIRFSLRRAQQARLYVKQGRGEAVAVGHDLARHRHRSRCRDLANGAAEIKAQL